MPSFGNALRALTPAAALWLAVSAGVSAQGGPSAKERYEAAVARDGQLRQTLQSAKDPPSPEMLAQAAQVITSYEALVRRFPTSGYADNALWQAATLADAAYQKSSRPADFDRSQRLYKWLVVGPPPAPSSNGPRHRWCGWSNPGPRRATFCPPRRRRCWQ